MDIQVGQRVEIVDPTDHFLGLPGTVVEYPVKTAGVPNDVCRVAFDSQKGVPSFQKVVYTKRLGPTTSRPRLTLGGKLYREDGDLFLRVNPKTQSGWKASLEIVRILEEFLRIQEQESPDERPEVWIQVLVGPEKRGRRRKDANG